MQFPSSTASGHADASTDVQMSDSTSKLQQCTAGLDSQQPDSQQPDSQQPDSQQPDSQLPELDSQLPDSQPDSPLPDHPQLGSQAEVLQKKQERRSSESGAEEAMDEDPCTAEPASSSGVADATPSGGAAEPADRSQCSPTGCVCVYCVAEASRKRRRLEQSDADSTIAVASETESPEVVWQVAADWHGTEWWMDCSLKFAEALETQWQAGVAVETYTLVKTTKSVQYVHDFTEMLQTNTDTMVVKKLRRLLAGPSWTSRHA